MEAVRIKYRLQNWGVFIDSSESELKAVPLHGGNEYPSVSVTYSRVMKETYDNMKIVLQNIKYSEHN